MNADVRFYYELLMRRLPVMAVLFILCAGIGIALALTLPPRYTADATLLVEGSKIPDNLAISTVQTEATEQLQIIEQRLMTRSNLIDIASKHRVFAGRTGMTPDAVVEEMRELTEIDLSAGRNKATIMTIAFTSGSPKVSASVVNEFVTLVLSTDARERQQQSGDTLEFFEQQVRRLNEELSRQSAEIVAFKEANNDALPEEQEYRLDRQATLQERLNLAARDKASLNDQRARLIAVGSASAAQTGPVTPRQQELNRLETELLQKLAIYAPDSPTIKFLEKRIEALKSDLPLDGDTVGQGGINSMLDVQLTEIDSRIAFIDEDVRRTEAELATLREAIERTPKVSIRLEELEREYDNTQALYSQANASRSAARTGEQIEVTAKGERVSVIENAVEPNEPTSPNRKLIAGGGVFVGTALATVFFTLTELLNRSIRRPLDLARALNIQPLATIPYLEEDASIRRRRALKTIVVVGFLIAIPIALWAVHTFYLPLDLLIEQTMTRVGL